MTSVLAWLLVSVPVLVQSSVMSLVRVPWSPSVSPSPEPADVVPQTPPDELVTPGTIGFLVTFFVAVALVLLVRDMNRRVVTVRVRAERADEDLRRQDDTRTAERPTGSDAVDRDGEPPAAPNG